MTLPPKDHNNPPTPIEDFNDIYLEATMWLDGEPVASEEYAAKVGLLKNKISAARKGLEDCHKAEKAPHLEAGRIVDDKYKPLIEQGKAAIKACGVALGPWLAELDRQKREKEAAAEEKRLEAVRLADIARQEAKLAQDNLAAQEAVKLAEKAEKDAKIKHLVARNDTAKITGQGRTIGMATSYEAVIVNSDMLRDYYCNEPEAIDLFRRLAQRDVSAGKRNIPGVDVKTVTKAV